MSEPKKGFIKGDMGFNVGEEPDVEERGPVLPLRVVVVADLAPRDEYNAGAGG